LPTLLQIFPLPESISLPAVLPKQIIPNDVAILGDVKSDGRRNYAKLWKDLIAAIRGESDRPVPRSKSIINRFVGLQRIQHRGVIPLGQKTVISFRRPILRMCSLSDFTFSVACTKASASPQC
jgi:hypothetical protein